jgi:DNA-binding PadR family transcriptional regulator
MRRGRHWGDRDAWSTEDRGEGRRGGRHGRRGMFENAELQLLLLHLIQEKPRHGYELMRAIEDLSRGAYLPSPGIAYPTLSMLKDLGYVTEAEAEGARRTFAITPEGQKHLEANAPAIATLLQRLGAVASDRERTDAGPVRRAMQNLKTALYDKLAADGSRETALGIAALIDEAAQKIERL